MLVSFDIKFIRRDQKQLRNGKACRFCEPTQILIYSLTLLRKGSHFEFLSETADVRK